MAKSIGIQTAYRYRIYPTAEQKLLFQKTFGCCRFVYNQALSWKEKAYAADKTCLSYIDLAGALTQIKHRYSWLKEVDSTALQQTLRHLDTAYKNYFSGTAKRPHFKRKRHSRMSFTSVMNISLSGSCITVPKAGPVKAVVHRLPPIDGRLTSITISMERDNTYYASLHYVLPDHQEKTEIDMKSAKSIGLDYKSDGLFVTSEGNVCGSPKFFRKMQKRLTHEQRGLRHKEKGSANYKKQQRKVARIHRTIANQRNDFLHKLSRSIAKNYDIVCVETLNMRAMANKVFHNGKATMDNGWGSFLSMLAYKLPQEKGILVAIDKWYPSSQLCHVCGIKNPEVKDLRIRKWECPKCHAFHDRDINAAINILNEGIRQYLSNVA